MVWVSLLKKGGGYPPPAPLTAVSSRTESRKYEFWGVRQQNLETWGHQGHHPHDDNNDEKDDHAVEENDKDDDNIKDNNNDKGI